MSRAWLGFDRMETWHFSATDIYPVGNLYTAWQADNDQRSEWKREIVTLTVQRPAKVPRSVDYLVRWQVAVTASCFGSRFPVEHKRANSGFNIQFALCRTDRGADHLSIWRVL